MVRLGKPAANCPLLGSYQPQLRHCGGQLTYGRTPTCWTGTQRRPGHRHSCEHHQPEDPWESEVNRVWSPERTGSKVSSVCSDYQPGQWTVWGQTSAVDPRLWASRTPLNVVPGPVLGHLSRPFGQGHSPQVISGAFNPAASPFWKQEPLAGTGQWHEDPTQERPSNTPTLRPLWAVDNQQWTTTGGQWTTTGRQRTVDNGQWTMTGGQRPVDSGQWPMDNRQWTTTGGQQLVTLTKSLSI